MRQIQFPLLLLCSLILIQPVFAAEKTDGTIRFATFNIAMGLKSHGDLYVRLESGEDEALQKAAAIIQQVRPDVLLVNEFDWFELDSALLFIRNYLDKPQFGNEPISFSHGLNGAVNTGVDSELDLNNNGDFGDPADAWGFGDFPGQFAMAVFSRFPMTLERGFRFFKWADMPDSLVPVNPDGSGWYPDDVYKKLRLSSKSHWDIKVEVGIQPIHFLVSHPTPPVFDGPEDRNGLRNHDEIRLWADYIDPGRAGYIYDDAGVKGGLPEGANFVIAGDLNADPVDGDSHLNAMGQLLEHPLVNSTCEPVSKGAVEASETQGGKNLEHKGNPAADTGDFNDQYVGNMQVDYVLPSATLNVVACGVFWPEKGQPGHEWIDVSDHRLVWIDVNI